MFILPTSFAIFNGSFKTLQNPIRTLQYFINSQEEREAEALIKIPKK